MPQDKRKSISYRSFVTCDDPKGIVECGAIRKSKTINCQKKVQAQQHNKVLIEGDKKQANQKTVVVSSSLAVIKEEKEEMSVQRVTRDLSKGADNMNHVINSLSQGKGQQDDIAKDLLRNAVDLQESLIMLEKLKKEASSIMSRRKQKQKLEEGTFDGMLSGVDAMSRNRTGYVQGEELHLGWQRPGKSSFELKKAVRESLLRQSVITNPIFEQDFELRKVDCSEMPSTSSSQSSSMVRSSNFAMSDCSTSSTASQRKQKKDSNLIVKLMGLDSPPLSPRWFREGDKLLNLSKPVYDIDSSSARKPRLGAREMYKKQRTVEEILDSLNFKGLLRSNPVNGMCSNSPSSEVFHFNDGLINERPPIVIMKPSRYPEEPAMSRFWLGEGIKPASNTRPVEENISSEAVNVAAGKPMKNAAFATAKAYVNLDPKPKKKQPVARKLSKVEKVTSTRSKEEERKDAKSREELCSRDQEQLTTSGLIKQKDGRFISKYHISSQQDHISSSSILDHKNQEMCVISGQWRRSRRPSLTEPNRKDKEERPAVYRKEIASTSNNGSVLPTVNNMTFDRFPEQKWSRTCQVHMKEYNIDKKSYMSKVHEARKHHPNAEAPTGDIVLTGTPEHLHRYDDSNSCYSEVTSVSTSEHSLVSPMDGDGNRICEITLVTTHENGVAVQTGDALHPIRTVSGTRSSKEKDYGTSKSCLTPRAKLKALLLSNPLFVSNLEELFDRQVHSDLTPCLNDETVADVNRARVLIDYANELMLLQSSQFPQAYLPQKWNFTCKSRDSLSLDRLLDEICKGIQDLRGYHRSVSDDTFSSDNLNLILNRDLRFKSGKWETGWRSMFSQDEIEQVTGELDKAILDTLIEEVVSEFLV